MWNNWLVIYALVFAGAFLSSLILTLFFRKIAWRIGFLDRPADNHKGHAQATPLLGGAAMFSAWLLVIVCGAIAVVSGWVPQAWRDIWLTHAAGFRSVSLELSFIVIAALLAVLLGLLDDRFALSAKAKFGGQFLVALLAVVGGGIKINLFGDVPFLAEAVTVFWIVLMMNSINFFDNMDGLAAGTIAIAMFFFLVIAALNGEYFLAAFAALNCGVCCGFWVFNSNPASIFMGDSGSHFIGFLAAVMAVQVTFFDKSFSMNFTRTKLL